MTDAKCLALARENDEYDQWGIPPGYAGINPKVIPVDGLDDVEAWCLSVGGRVVLLDRSAEMRGPGVQAPRAVHWFLVPLGVLR